MRDRIYITQGDHEKLQGLIAGRRGSRTDADHLHALEEELERAEVLDNLHAVPADVITMGSEVRLMDLESGEIKEYRLVFPFDARGEKDLSVLAPIGTAILGYRAGDMIEWPVPKGIRRLKIVTVLFQPEAAGIRSDEAPAA